MEILKLDLNKSGPDRASESELQFQVSLLAAVAALVASFIARFVFGAALVPELMAQYIFAVAPMLAVEVAVGMLGPFAKHLGFLACAATYFALLIGAGIVYLRGSSHAAKRMARASGPLFALLVWAITVALVLPAMGGGLLGSRLRQGALLTCVSLFLIHAIYGASLLLARIQYIERPPTESSKLVSRRRVVRGIGYAVLAVGVYDIASSLFGSWLRSGSGRVKHGSGSFPDIDGLAREVTPARDFYVVSKNAFDPQIETRHWKLEVSGLVETPLSFSYEDLSKLPAVEQYATLECISNEVGGDLIGNALWRGVPLREVLKLAGVKPGVVDIVLRASDDYTDSISLDRAMTEGTLLVYEMNGEPLSPEHGFPLRLLVPGIYGMKNVKWITQIEAVDFDFKGYWQRRGWDDRAEYKTMSRIDAPSHPVKGEAAIAGIAFAGDRGITKVEVSTDGGQMWEQAEIRQALSPYTWVLWQKRWRPEQSGKHSVAVRATDGRGVVQTSDAAPPAPSGSSGYHRVIISSE